MPPAHWPLPPALCAQYIDAISNKQGELENYVSDGYKTALTEERRRFCFLVEKQCAVAKNSAAYHSKVSSTGSCRGPSVRAAGPSCRRERGVLGPSTNAERRSS